MEYDPLLIFPIADPHIGSTKGLHPNYIRDGKNWVSVDEHGGWYYKNNENYYLNSKQKRIWNHFETGINQAAKVREAKKCRILFMVMGDAIDGDHHQTHELVTRNENEQAKTFNQLMLWTFEKIGFEYGRDKLVFIEGTESHTRDNEETIAQDLSAEKFGKSSCIPFLEVDIQDNLFWFYHHGVHAGYSYNRGSGLYNYLKRIYTDRRMNNKRPPNFVMTADKHDREHQTYRHNGHTLDGLVLPPFQDKTRFVNKLPNAIVNTTKVGFSPVMVENGKVEVLTPYLTEMPLNEVLVW
jgi:hypothetical protein